MEIKINSLHTPKWVYITKEVPEWGLTLEEFALATGHLGNIYLANRDKNGVWTLDPAFSLAPIAVQEKVKAFISLALEQERLAQAALEQEAEKSFISLE